MHSCASSLNQPKLVFAYWLHLPPKRTFVQESYDMEVGLEYQWYVLPHNIAPILFYAWQTLPEIPLEDPTIAFIVLHSKIHTVLPYF